MIKEEFEEAEEELVLAKQSLKYAWHSIRSDNTDLIFENIDELKRETIHLAMEACQVAAMCVKAEQSLRGEENGCKRSN